MLSTARRDQAHRATGTLERRDNLDRGRCAWRAAAHIVNMLRGEALQIVDGQGEPMLDTTRPLEWS